MTSADVTLQAQISSVLDSLIKAAVGELTRLFEARASARCTVHRDAQEHCKGQTNKTFTSIAVQVDGATLCLDPPVTGQCCSLEESEKSVRQRRKREDHGEETLLDPLLVEANEPTDQRTSVLRKDEICKISSSSNPESSTEELHTKGSNSNDHSAVPNTQAKQKQRSDKTKGKNGRNARNKTKLFLQKEETQAPAPEPECPEAAAQVKPPEAGVSTAQHTPVSTHGPYLRVSLWDRLATIRDMMHEPKKTKTSQDQKLLQPCSVQLVNLSLVERGGKLSVVGGSDGAQGKSGTPKDLRSHQSVHTGHRLCCFTKCGNGLWRLQRLVSQSNSHCCKICGKRFKRRKVLRRHERFHTGEKPYACPRCHKAFALRKSLRRHQRFHTGEKPHICPQCGKSFRLRDNLKAHLRFHTGERPFTCPTCSKSFRISRNLTEHQLSHL